MLGPYLAVHFIFHCITDRHLPFLRRGSKIASIVDVKINGAHILPGPVMWRTFVLSAHPVHLCCIYWSKPGPSRGILTNMSPFFLQITLILTNESNHRPPFFLTGITILMVQYCLGEKGINFN